MHPLAAAPATHAHVMVTHRRAGQDESWLPPHRNLREALFYPAVGFGRIVVSEIEIPNMPVHLV
jgi:hypothetical protein